MISKLFHIYGPLYINSYGSCIVLGLWAFMKQMQRDTRFKKLITLDQFYSILTIGILSAIIGGRLLYFTSTQTAFAVSDFFALWNGGFSVLGSIIAVITLLPGYLWINQIAIIPLLDLAAIYTPLLQSISRIGCFCAGCCYGIESSVPWTITYTHQDCIAPLFTPLHPTQLYSGLLLFGGFLFLRGISRQTTRTGTMLMLFLMVAGTERFLVDYFRGDREYFSNELFTYFSINQWIALFLFISAAISFLVITYYNKEV